MATADCQDPGDPQLLQEAVPLGRFRELLVREAPNQQVRSHSVLIRELLDSSLILTEDWRTLSAEEQDELRRESSRAGIFEALIRHKLLTPYLAERIAAGTRFGLVLGNYRVLDRLGSGGGGVVYLAEHVQLRTRVAVKVLTAQYDDESIALPRFAAEMRAVAQLRHPNIVGAIDAGRIPASAGGHGEVHYFVMEHVPGQNLEEQVEAHGPMPPAEACDIVHQVASALAEAHKHGLVHRDIKPSNIRVTPEGQAKLLDFGLVRRFGNRLTEPGVVLGTLDYLAPEQAKDASAVDIRADIFALGGTLFWCLTGHPPFPPGTSVAQILIARLTQKPPSVRKWRPDLPAELDALVARMMAVNPDDRLQKPDDVMRALVPFLRPLPAKGPAGLAADLSAAIAPDTCKTETRLFNILVVDDEPHIRAVCRCALRLDGVHCDEAATGAQAVIAVAANRYDLVLLDVDMPELTGLETLRQLRRAPPTPHLKVVMISGRATPDEMALMLAEGADDYLTKPFSTVQLSNRVKAALRLKAAQDRADSLTNNLVAVNAELERILAAQGSDLIHARNAIVVALASLVGHRSTESEGHLARMQRYCRCLAEEAAGESVLAEQIDEDFIRLLESAVPLHDIGTMGLPDHVLQKAGKFDADDRAVMEAHAVLGAEALHKVAAKHGAGVTFLPMAIDIVRHHHERYDGSGYPDRLVGEEIPLAARITTIADVYDALRCRRSYKPPLGHSAAVELMTKSCSGQFDPRLLAAFRRAAPRFDQVFKEVPD